MNRLLDRNQSAKRKISRPPEEEVSGQLAQTASGTVLVNTVRYPPSYRHGRFRARDFTSAGRGLAALCGDPKLEQFNPYSAIFLDTETTGLAGGTGTLPFLVGIGRFKDDDSFEVEQFFCREPGDEPAQLDLLTDRLEKGTSLVTFNGKAFDIPLLNTRFVLNRKKNPGYSLPHLDLLHVARRIFKRRLKGCSLGNLETQILGFNRVGDIAGHEIPAAYAAYLRGGPREPMEAVLEHNALDLVGLAALGALLEEMYRDPRQVEHASDHLGLAKAALAADHEQVADEHLMRAGTAKEGAVCQEALAMAAKIAIRQGALAEAKSHLIEALGRGDADPEIHLRLTKLMEHHLKNLPAALDHALKSAGAEDEQAHLHRIARLKRKIAGPHERMVETETHR